MNTEKRFEKTNLVNSSIIINRKHIAMSLHIPQLQSVRISGSSYSENPETDFNRELGEGGLGITEGDLYYITVPIGCVVYIITRENKRIIVECTEDGINEIDLLN